MDLDFENTRRDMIALRVKYGADTPIGHRCSNIIEGLEEQGSAGTDRQADAGAASVSGCSVRQGYQGGAT